MEKHRLVKRILVVGLAAITLAAIGFAVHWRLQLETRLHTAIEEQGSQMTGTRVEVGGVDLWLLRGEGRITSLRVANPPGHSDRDAIHFDEVQLDIEPLSYFQGPLVFERIVIHGVEVNLEMQDGRRSNLRVIGDHLYSYDSRMPRSAPPNAGRIGTPTEQIGAGDLDTSGEARRVKVREFIFEEGRLIADIEAFGGVEGDYELPPLRLTELGGEEGRSATMIGLTVMVRYTGTILTTIAEQQLDRLLRDGEGGLREAAGDLLRRLFD